MKGSNAIENIITTDKRIKELVSGSSPITHDENEIIGYRDALKIIHEEYTYIDISERTIKLLHKTMEGQNSKDAGDY